MSLKTDDLWFSTDTSTACPDTNCKGHTVDSNGAPNVGSYPHRALYWPHRWTGSAWVDAKGSQLIVTSEIAAGAIVADKLAANAVTTAKLDALAVTTAKLDALAVTTAKLDASAVTAAKIDANAIVGKLIQTSNYEESGGVPTAGAKMYNSAGVGNDDDPAIKCSTAGIQIGHTKVSEAWFSQIYTATILWWPSTLDGDVTAINCSVQLRDSDYTLRVTLNLSSVGDVAMIPSYYMPNYTIGVVGEVTSWPYSMDFSCIDITNTPVTWNSLTGATQARIVLVAMPYGITGPFPIM